MEATTGDPTEDRKNGTGTGETEKLGRTQTERLTVAALDVVLVEAETLEGGGRTEKTVEAEVHKGVVVTKPNPRTKTYRESGAAVRTVGTEVG